MDSKEGKSCEQRIDAQLKGRLEEMFPDPEDWSVLQCARHLRRQGLKYLRRMLWTSCASKSLNRHASRLLNPGLSVEAQEKSRQYACPGEARRDLFEPDWSPDSEAWTEWTVSFQRLV